MRSTHHHGTHLSSIDYLVYGMDHAREDIGTRDHLSSSHYLGRYLQRIQNESSSWSRLTLIALDSQQNGIYGTLRNHCATTGRYSPVFVPPTSTPMMCIVTRLLSVLTRIYFQTTQKQETQTNVRKWCLKRFVNKPQKNRTRDKTDDHRHIWVRKIPVFQSPLSPLLALVLSILSWKGIFTTVSVKRWH